MWMQMAPPQNELVSKTPSEEVRGIKMEEGTDDCPRPDQPRLFT
jgi:hypothetical protein